MPDPEPAQAPPAHQAPQRKPHALVVALLLLTAIIVAYRAANRLPDLIRTVGPVRPIPPAARETAHQFRASSLRGPGEIALYDFRGQVVVLNFFASWCGPCELEAADLERTWQAVQNRGVVFMGVAIQDQERDAQAFLSKHGLTYRAVFDEDGAIMRAYRINGIPTTIVVDGDGRIAGRHSGIFVGDEGRGRLLAFIEAARVAPP
ncbi:MAG: TlpA disulfide reductase family protein [Armatimonadota bacterium]